MPFLFLCCPSVCSALFKFCPFILLNFSFTLIFLTLSIFIANVLERRVGRIRQRPVDRPGGGLWRHPHLCSARPRRVCPPGRRVAKDKALIEKLL